MIGKSVDWTPVDAFLSQYFSTAEERATVRASSFSASLELVREGRIELRQSRAFGTLYLRSVEEEKSTGEGKHT
jgi:segregation and condensation protein A